MTETITTTSCTGSAATVALMDHLHAQSYLAIAAEQNLDPLTQ